MNASGLGLAAILLVVLLAVVWGAQQMDTAQQNQIQQLMQQRDQAVALAQEAKAQRDDIAGEMVLLKGRVGDLQAGLQQKDEQIAAMAGKLEQANQLTSEQTARIQDLEGQKAGLQQQLQTEQARLQEMDKLMVTMNGQLDQASKAYSEKVARVQYLEAQTANLPGIPVTAGENEQSIDPVGQSSTDCQKVSVDGYRSPLGGGLVVLISMVALGGSGYVLYQEKKHDAL